MKARWFKNYVCRDGQHPLDRMDLVILDVFDNPKRTQKNFCNRNVILKNILIFTTLKVDPLCERASIG